jgi:hypothetical protein
VGCFSFRPLDSDAGGSPRHEPRRLEPGERPRFEAALAVVNRDLVAALPDEPPLVLMLCPASGEDDGPDGVHVALSDGRWQGNAVHPQGPEMSEEPDDTLTVLGRVADAAQEVVTVLLRRVWPVCPYHGTGTHPRPAGTTSDWCRDAGDEGGSLVWWCGGHQSGDCHDLAQVGELAAALPGRQRRAARRRQHGRGGG